MWTILYLIFGLNVVPFDRKGMLVGNLGSQGLFRGTRGTRIANEGLRKTSVSILGGIFASQVDERGTLQ